MATLRPFRRLISRASAWVDMKTILKGLILAQNERWRRGLGMQVEREPVL